MGIRQARATLVSRAVEKPVRISARLWAGSETSISLHASVLEIRLLGGLVSDSTILVPPLQGHEVTAAVVRDAVSAEHPVYVVRDNQPVCPNGIIELTFDEETGNLIYTFTDTKFERWDADAVLEPANG